MGKDLTPFSLQSILGQQQVINILQNHLRQKRLHHAYLFFGRAGTGKKSTAIAFAKAILCDEKLDDACNQCNACQRFASKNHPDYTEIGPEEDSAIISIDQIRLIRHELSYRPYESAKRIFVIENADLMTPQASNSLLKSLEEPPSYGLFVLTTHNMESLLPTIKSRTLHLPFAYLSEKVIKKHLEQNLPNLENSATIARMAQGSLGLALQLAKNEELLAWRETLLTKIGQLNTNSFIDVLELVEFAIEVWGKDYRSFLALLLSFFRDAVFLHSRQEKLIYNQDLIDLIAKLRDHFQAKDCEKIISEIEQTKYSIQKNVNHKLALEAMFLKINGLRK